MEEVIKQIETKGYCRIQQVYRPEEIGRALELVREWRRKTESSLSNNVPYLNRNQPMVYNLQNKDYYFLEFIFASTIIQRTLMHFLNDVWYKQISQTEPNYILRSYLARSSNVALPLHIDSFVPYTGDQVVSMQVAIALEDQDESNGCTVFVPGSHKSGQYVEQGSLKDAVPVELKAGDVSIWDSRTWHGAVANNSSRTRWAVIATFSRWWLKQAFNITQNLPQEIYKKLTDSQKAILGFCSIPYDNESEGIDMKRGYDSLLADVSQYRH
jgi:hypothetical protein